MDPHLERALEPVLRDLRTTTGRAPARVEDRDCADDPHTASAMLLHADGSGAGVRVSLGAALVEQVVEVADQVQEWAVEDLWGSAPTNWPPCPQHPTTHPLTVGTVGDAAWWLCPRDGTPVAEVGTLG